MSSYSEFGQACFLYGFFLSLRERRALRAKLEVERERLLSPYELRLKAEKLGLGEPKPGQVRRMGDK